MTDYWRPGLKMSYKEKVENFLSNHEEVPFDDPREFLKFCTDKTIVEIETSEQQIRKEQEKIKKELRESLEELD